METYRANKMVVALLGILVIIALGFILRILGSILKPFLIALFLSFLFDMPIKLMRRIKIPRVIAIIIILIFTFLFFYLIGLLIYSNVNSFKEEFPAYEEKFQNLYLGVLEHLHIPENDVQKYYDSINWPELLQKFSIHKLLSASAGSFMSFVSNLFLILLFMVYILLGRDELLQRIVLAFPSDGEKFLTVYENINTGIQRYVAAKALISLGTGISATIILLIFGVDFAWVWGLLTFLLDFIPNIGSTLAIVPPFLVAIFQFGGLIPAVWIALLLVLVQLSWGNIVEPAVMGKRMNLSPLVVIVSLIFWGFIWGPIGMVLAVPISSAIQIICSHIETLKPISVLMADE